MSVRRFVSLIFAVGMVLVVYGAPALATLSHPYQSSFGSFTNVQGVAVDQSTGDVYVLDTGTGGGSLLKFDSAGNQLKFSGISGEPTAIIGLQGGGGSENEIAVDNSSGPAKGDVYVAVGASNGSNIDIFDSGGKALGTLSNATAPWGETCGVAVDPSGSVYVGIYGGDVDKFVPAASPVTNADYVSAIQGASNPCNLAVDSNGSVFALHWPSGPLTRYETSQFGSLSATGSVVDLNGGSVAVNPANDHIYVDEGGQVSEFGSHGEPVVKPISIFANEGEGAITGSFGIAVNETSGDTYVSSGKGRIGIFGPGLLVPTTVTAEPSNITTTSASIGGSVNPEGLAVTDCELEYGLTAAYGQSVSCPASVGSGSTLISETAELSGLASGTTYHYRLVASNANGQGQGIDRTFTTEVFYPVGITGLPDGRVYEQVTPAFKNGNFYDIKAGFTFGLASSGGNSVVYPMSGPVGTASSGMVAEFASTRTPGSEWQTVSTIPRPKIQVTITDSPLTLIPSSDFKRFVFISQAPFVDAEPQLTEGAGVNIFRSEDPTVEPAWLGGPPVPSSIPGPGDASTETYMVAGASPDLETVYFSYAGTLTAQDESRLPNVAVGFGHRQADPWGFYEWKKGQLVSAGVLPDGQLNPFGAVPASTAGENDFARRNYVRTQAEAIDNQVSKDGSRAFFVSPDPDASTVTNGERCASQPPCTSEPPELYVRQSDASGGKVSVLVSRSELPGHEGEAAADGVVSVSSPARARDGAGTDIYASPDGSHAFFVSEDRLTLAAPEDNTRKEYDYNLETGTLMYIPGVSGPVAAVTDDGSEMLFENKTGATTQLELWKDGPNGGTVTPVTQMPHSQGLDLTSVHANGDGSVFVFRSNAAIPGGFNNSAESEQVYRYVVSSGAVDCVSCPPAGVDATGEARMSYNNYDPEIKGNGGNADPMTTIETRGMSSDGSRVFFDTPAALVPQDTNGTRDVYEWEAGHVYLISSGNNPKESQILDSSESGGDVFFATSSELVPGDADAAPDIYDARIPRPGDNPPPVAVPCKGSVCQGPPNVPDLLGEPASASFSGAGNLAPAVEASPKRKATPKKKVNRKKAHRKRRARKGKGARGSTAHRDRHRQAVAGNGKGQRNRRGK